MLESLIRHPEGFTLALALADDAAYEAELIAACRAALAPLAVAIVELDEASLQVGLGSHIVAAGGDAAAVFVTGIGPLVDPGAPEQPVLAQLGLARDRFGSSLSCPLVLWMPAYAVAALPFRAPNLWSWVTLQAPFPLDEAVLRQALDDLAPDAAPAVRAALGGRLAAALMSQDRSDDADNLFQQALPLYRTTGDRVGEATTLGALGDTASGRGRYDDADTLYQQALPIYRTIGARVGEANTLLSAGRLARAQTDHDRAHRVLLQAAHLYRQIGLDDWAQQATDEANAAG